MHSYQATQKVENADTKIYDTVENGLIILEGTFFTTKRRPIAARTIGVDETKSPSRFI